MRVFRDGSVPETGFKGEFTLNPCKSGIREGFRLNAHSEGILGFRCCQESLNPDDRSLFRIPGRPKTGFKVEGIVPRTTRPTDPLYKKICLSVVRSGNTL